MKYLALCLAALALCVSAAHAATTRVSVASDGTQGDAECRRLSISADGRYVAFGSYAANLVSGDTNKCEDIFVRDRQTGQTTRVSVASDGTPGNGIGRDPSISADGRYVAFDSWANNLVPGDTNGRWDVFVRDRGTGQTTRASVASGGTQADSESDSPSISSDGRYVTFYSEATNLVSGDTNGKGDIFVRDRQAGTTTRVSVATGGAQGNDLSHHPSISGDGRYVVFVSNASNLVPNDTEGYADVFVRDRQAGTTTRVSVASGGTEGNDHSGQNGVCISADGRYVAFDSWASNLAPGANGQGDIIVHDRLTGQTTRASVASDGTEAAGSSYFPSISADGRYVAFQSDATNLVPGDANAMPDVFVRDRQTSSTTRVSVASDGTEGNGDSDYSLSISADGSCVTFSSEAMNLVSGDTNGCRDVFVRDHAPLNVSLSPSTGSFAVGTKLTFTSRYLDPDGYANLANCYLLVNTTLNQANASFLRYDANANKLYVKNDANTGWLGGYAPGAANTIENSYVKLYCAETTKGGSGATLTINWKISFKAAMLGKTCGAWMLVYDDQDLRDGYDQMGSGINIGPTPSNLSLSPSTGSFTVGTKLTCTSRYQDSEGYANLANCYVLINTTLNQANGAFLRYDANANKLYVKNDANSAWLGGYAPGAADVIENSYVKLYCADTTKSGSGNTLTINWRISFKPAISGKTCGAWMLVYDDQGRRDGYDQMGSGIQLDQTPSNVGLSPNTGSFATGAKLTFTGDYSDPDGMGNLANCYLLINTTLNQATGAFLRYDANNGVLYVKNDANTSWLGGYYPGTAYVIENSYVKLDCAETHVLGWGTGLTITWGISFKTAMAGKTCGAWMLVYDDIGLRDGYDRMGTFTVQ